MHITELNLPERSMIATRPYILYSLPKSKTTQKLTGGKIEKVWKNIELFLSHCTSSDLNQPRKIELIAYSADEDHGEKSELTDKLLLETQAVFGRGVTKPIGYMYSANTPLKQTRTEWNLTAHDLDKTLKFVIANQPYPKYNLGPLTLIISYNFNLVYPESKNELTNQQFQSSLFIWLSRSNCVSPSLCFPFNEPNQDFWNYLKSIEAFLPFKFDKKWLRLGQSNKRGTSNMFSKI